MKIKSNQIKLILFLIIGMLFVFINTPEPEIESLIIEYNHKFIENSDGSIYVDQRYEIGSNELCIQDCLKVVEANNFNYHSSMVRKFGECNCRYIK